MLLLICIRNLSMRLRKIQVGNQHSLHVLFVCVCFFKKTFKFICYNLPLKMEGFVFPNPESSLRSGWTPLDSPPRKLSGLPSEGPVGRAGRILVPCEKRGS